MKKLLLVLITATFLAIGSAAVLADDKPLPDRNKVLCTCGCEMYAVQCGCASAIEALKRFDEKVKTS